MKWISARLLRVVTMHACLLSTSLCGLMHLWLVLHTQNLLYTFSAMHAYSCKCLALTYVLLLFHQAMYKLVFFLQLTA